MIEDWEIKRIEDLMIWRFKDRLKIGDCLILRLGNLGFKDLLI
jgi:hypothetical protein